MRCQKHPESWIGLNGHGYCQECARERTALGPSDATACSRLADYLESPHPYRKHVTKERLWLVLDSHGDSVLWSDQELAVDAAVEALNHMAGINAENVGSDAPEAVENP